MVKEKRYGNQQNADWHRLEKMTSILLFPRTMPLLIALLLRLLNISYARDAAGDLTIGLTKLNNATSFSTVTNPDLDSPLSSPATLRGSEATHVPILTSDNGHKALHLDHESNVFVYVSFDEPSSCGSPVTPHRPILS